VSADTINTLKKLLQFYWSNQDVLCDYKADLHGIRNRSIVTSVFCRMWFEIQVLELQYEFQVSRSAIW